ncbi:hypothetical protein E1B28_008001 [Marasmius oreades]|uniref:FAD-binding domain-containing protein n=1 Tax=Marasmius oreades TaxID=181124 RepID=A0A9P7S463_9AGAR|nr:uncharacterized protein E1B28_008001 [Marasmius oreades]KAG7094401.1 hypothetical protein E1B28_008001 [Marasmius oreades]
MGPSVLVVGSGPAGLVLALTLLRNGVSVRIIEKNDAIFVGQRGAGLMPRTLEMYKFLQILPQIEAKCTTIPPFRMYTSPEGDKPVKEMPFVEELEGRPQYYRINAAFFGQDEHQAFLAEVIEKEYPGTRVEFSTELTTFEQHGDHVVAHLYKSKSDETEVINFDFVVGADGAHSTVRKKLGLKFLGETYSENELVIGDIEITKGYDPSHVKTWGSMGDKMLFLRPYRKDGKDFGWFLLGGVNVDIQKAASDRVHLVHAFYDIIGKRNIQFGELKASAAWRANVRMADKFGEGRVFVTGDAGHVHSPTGGQGLNSGIQDSVNLGWKLALVQKGLAPMTLLDTYTTERIPVIASMLNKTTDIMRKTFTKSQDAVGWQGWVRGWEIRQLGINYRGSPILVDERYTDSDEPVDPYRSGLDETVHAGDRAPNAPGLVVPGKEGKIDLFDVLDVVSHTVIVFEPEPEPSLVSRLKEEVDGLVDSYPRGSVKSVVIYPQRAELLSLAKDGSVLVDGEGYAHEHYKVKQDEAIVVVVRPDGYIGAVVRGSSGVKEYFTRIFVN